MRGGQRNGGHISRRLVSPASRATFPTHPPALGPCPATGESGRRGGGKAPLAHSISRRRRRRPKACTLPMKSLAVRLVSSSLGSGRVVGGTRSSIVGPAGRHATRFFVFNYCHVPSLQSHGPLLPFLIDQQIHYLSHVAATFTTHLRLILNLL